jgi:hypothetical protein
MRALSVLYGKCDQFARIRQAWQSRTLQPVATLQIAVFVEALFLHPRNSLFTVLSDLWYCSKYDSELSIRFQVTELLQKAVGWFLCTFSIRTPPGLRSLSGWCRGFDTCCYSLVRCLPVLSYDGEGLTIGWPTCHSLKLIRRGNIPLPNLWTQNFGTESPVLGAGRPGNCGSIRGRVKIFFCAPISPNQPPCTGGKATVAVRLTNHLPPSPEIKIVWNHTYTSACAFVSVSVFLASFLVDWCMRAFLKEMHLIQHSWNWHAEPTTYWLYFIWILYLLSDDKISK